jgi:hypothetical protein
MRIPRVPLLLLAVLALAAGAVLTPALQSRIVQHLLRRSLDPTAELASARIGWDGGVKVRDLRLQTAELRLVVADAEVRLRPGSLLRQGSPEFQQVRLRGCVVELQASTGVMEGGREALRSALSTSLVPVRLEAEGEVRLPAESGVIGFRAAGEGLAAGGDGALRVDFTLRPADTGLSVLEGRLRVQVAAGVAQAPLRAAVEARVRGEGWSRELTVAGEWTERADAGGGGGMLRVRSGEREVARLSGTEPQAGADWRLRWWADFREEEVARFFPEPRWSGERLVGEGELRWSPGSGLVAVEGKAEVELGAAARTHPTLARLGLTGGDAEFALRAGDRVWAVERLAVRLRTGNAAPSLRLSVRQPWAVDWRARSFQAREPDADLIELELLDLTLPPLWIDGLTVGGGLIRGRLLGRLSAGGLALRTAGSLQASGLFCGSSEGRWAENLSLSLQGGLRVAPEGWSAEVDELRLGGKGGEFAVLEGKGGRLAGEQQTWKMAGRGRVELAPVAASLGGGYRTGLTAGSLEVDAGATGGALTAIHAHVRASGLRGATELPDLRLDARVDRESSGRLRFHVPLEAGTGPNLSRVLAAGAWAPVAGGGGRLELEVAGPRLDLVGLGGLLPVLAGGSAAAPARTAPWAGWSGTVVARIDELVAGAGAPWRNARARLRLDESMVQAEELESVLADGASLRASGTLRHTPGEAEPYSVQSAVVVRDWNPVGPEATSGWFSGKLDLSGAMRSRAADLAGLGAALEAEVHLVSRGGTLRVFPVNLPPVPAGSGRVAEILAAAGGALESLGVRRDPPLSRGRAVAELSATLHPLAFDQLSVVAARDVAGNLSLRHLVVLTPELRLTGGGNLLRRPGSGFLEGSLALELQLRARGRPAELLRGLGALDEVPDEWGYAAAGLPLRVRGTLVRPDASDLSVRLAALALERNPVSERAADWFNRIRRAQ